MGEMEYNRERDYSVVATHTPASCQDVFEVEAFARKDFAVLMMPHQLLQNC